MEFFFKMALPRWLQKTPDESEDTPRYRRLWRYTVFLTLLVAIIPLGIVTGVNYYLYQKTVQTETEYDIIRNLSNTSRSLEFIIEERLSVLKLLFQEKNLAELTDHNPLLRTMQNLKSTFSGFIDLGIIDSNGKQTNYIGPYNLMGSDYSKEDWFHEVRLRELYVSDVFMGHRQFPHFVLAVKKEIPKIGFYILRATLDMELLTRMVFLPGMGNFDDIFIISKNGILQTPSRYHGSLLEQVSIPTPAYTPNTEIVGEFNEKGESYILGYRYISNTPFILMIIKKPKNMLLEWFRHYTEMIFFVSLSVILIFFVVLWSSTSMVIHIRKADQRRAQMLHNIEYTNKMATIGQLSASVAHEINNPLAIINEKAGLLRDLVIYTADSPQKEKTLKALETIIKSVERCSGVTHRLLGFTRRVEVNKQQINLANLLNEVLEFLGKEALHREVQIITDFPSNIPQIESDRGQLQQVFLNIINNAFAAVKDGGRIELCLESQNAKEVAVKIRDNGSGIPEELLPRIFDPFFSTKGEFGTGLGLSITYSLVQKLGGRIDVQSKVGVGTTFIVVLPIKSTTPGERHETI